jgi:hypothetical protein
VNDLAAVLTALGVLVAAIGSVSAVVVGYLNRRAMTAAKDKASDAAAAALVAKTAAEDSKREIIATKDGVFELGKQIDGRLSQLLELTRESALAEGRLEGPARPAKRARP